jgi:transcriptional regulator with XRE-family HTH domain
VKRRREAREESQQTLADRVRVKQPFIVQIEAGPKGVSLDVLQRLARALQCTMAELLGERPRKVTGQ